MGAVYGSGGSGGSSVFGGGAAGVTTCFAGSVGQKWGGGGGGPATACSVPGGNIGFAGGVGASGVVVIQRLHDQLSDSD